MNTDFHRSRNSYSTFPIRVHLCQSVAKFSRVVIESIRLGPQLLNASGSYFFSAGAAGRSEFHISAPHFHLPLASFMVNSYVPLTKPISPDFATSTLVAFQLITRPGLASRSCQIFRTASFVVA